MEKGWTVPEAGFFGTETDGRETLAALSERRRERDAWKAAYTGLREEFMTSVQEQDRRLRDLREQFARERSAWKVAAERKQGGQLFWVLVFGGLGFALGKNQ